MSYIVERQSALGDTASYTGPMRTLEHAERERNAWIASGYRARVIDYTDDVKARVRRWLKGKRWPYEYDAATDDRAMYEALVGDAKPATHAAFPRQSDGHDPVSHQQMRDAGRIP